MHLASLPTPIRSSLEPSRPQLHPPLPRESINNHNQTLQYVLQSAITTSSRLLVVVLNVMMIRSTVHSSWFMPIFSPALAWDRKCRSWAGGRLWRCHAWHGVKHEIKGLPSPRWFFVVAQKRNEASSSDRYLGHHRQPFVFNLCPPRLPVGAYLLFTLSRFT